MKQFYIVVAYLAMFKVLADDTAAYLKPENPEVKSGDEVNFECRSPMKYTSLYVQKVSFEVTHDSVLIDFSDTPDWTSHDYMYTFYNFTAKSAGNYTCKIIPSELYKNVSVTTQLFVINNTDVEECISVTCLNGGTCINKFGRFHCDCPPGFEGDRCGKDSSVKSSGSSPNTGLILSIVLPVLGVVVIILVFACWWFRREITRMGCWKGKKETANISGSPLDVAELDPLNETEKSMDAPKVDSQADDTSHLNGSA